MKDKFVRVITKGFQNNSLILSDKASVKFLTELEKKKQLAIKNLPEEEKETLVDFINGKRYKRVVPKNIEPFKLKVEIQEV